MGLKPIPARTSKIGITRSLVNGVPSNQKRLPMSTIGIDVPGTRSSSSRVTSFLLRTSMTLAPSTCMGFKGSHAESQKKWKCPLCHKSLSSKRSYDEHANVHNHKRPFQCKDCNYAAASQMTLRRHRLRNHTSKEGWSYRCPYCDYSFMEPASYKVHVQTRHTGRSATFGCPYEVCPFQSLCARYFKEHLEKHAVNRMPRSGLDFGESNMTNFLVDDEHGFGIRRVPVSTSLPVKKSAPPLQKEQKQKPFHSLFTKQPVLSEDIMKEPLRIPKSRPQPVVKHEQLYPTLPINSAQPDILPADSDWIEAEVEVESADTVIRLPNGQTDDMDLD